MILKMGVWHRLTFLVTGSWRVNMAISGIVSWSGGFEVTQWTDSTGYMYRQRHGATPLNCPSTRIYYSLVIVLSKAAIVGLYILSGSR